MRAGLALVVLQASAVIRNEAAVVAQLLANFRVECSDGAKVIAPHPLCEDQGVYFPAEISSFDQAAGNITLMYGRADNLNGNPEDAWSNSTSVRATDVLFYSCRDDASGWPEGDVGRGFAYLPQGCNGTDCSNGCRVSPPTACQQGEFLEIGEVCTARCEEEGHEPTQVNITCDLTTFVEDRTFECLQPVVYCEDSEIAQVLNSTEASSVSAEDLAKQLGCELGGVATTTTTTAALLDRVLAGCSELQQLGPRQQIADPDVELLPVGMPAAFVGAGALYFEVQLEGSGDRVGWVDSAWGRDGVRKSAHQWLSAPLGPGIVSVALSIISRVRGVVQFARDGIWDIDELTGEPREIDMIFEPPLIPVAFISNKAKWLVPYESWAFVPPLVRRFLPLTSRAFPVICRWPLDYVLFSAPPRCGPGFELLNTTEDCNVAGFHLGLFDQTATSHEYIGWPPGCFRCIECDLSGDLYLNTADPANTSTDMNLKAPEAAAVCRRIDKDRTTTTTTLTLGRSTSTTMVAPLYRLFIGECSDGYSPILLEAECEEAALYLNLYDVTVRLVVWDGGGASSARWPPGCFQCPLCDSGSLYINDISFHNNSNAIRSGNSALHAERIDAQPLCRAPHGAPTTFAPTVTPPANQMTDPLEVNIPSGVTEFQTPDTQTTTTTIRRYNPLGTISCGDPYQLPEEDTEPVWLRMAIMVGGGVLGFCLCCCCCCGMWIFGVFDRCYECVENWFDRHPRIKNSCCCRLCRRCCWCCIAMGDRLSPRGSPRFRMGSPRKGAEDKFTSEGSKPSDPEAGDGQAAPGVGSGVESQGLEDSMPRPKSIRRTSSLMSMDDVPEDDGEGKSAPEFDSDVSPTRSTNGKKSKKSLRPSKTSIGLGE